MSGFFSRLLRALFGDSKAEPPPVHEPQPAPEVLSKSAPDDGVEQHTAALQLKSRSEASFAATPPAPVQDVALNPTAARVDRPPFFFQVGLDFGTAYTKCVIRDVGKDRARVFVRRDAADTTVPYLFPSRVDLVARCLRRPDDYSRHYAHDTVSLMKIALAAQATRRNHASPLQAMLALARREGLDESDIQAFPLACVVAHLGHILGAVRRDLHERHPDFGKHPRDYIAINMALPAADVGESSVTRIFLHALRLAWIHAGWIASADAIDIAEIVRWIRTSSPEEGERNDGVCHVYPEVSANLHGYVRSSSSKEGLFLFCDTGAGTVDQSVFLFSRINGNHFTYLGAQVLPLGSSEIERRAAAHLNDASFATLEKLRRQKESGGATETIDRVREELHRELADPTLTLLAKVKCFQLANPDRIHDLNLIFAGGGHARHPYETGVRKAFSHQIFTEGFDPPAIGLPIPPDLDLDGGDLRKAYSRLSVAYGLAFPYSNLPPGTLPGERPPPTPVPPPVREPPHFPSKDDC